MQVVIRPIVNTDAETLAELHIASWRSAYRGMVRDEYLDKDIVPDRFAVWSELMKHPAPSLFGFVAEADKTPVGFAFLRGAHDAVWGTLLDNIHVLPGFQGKGVGRLLIAAAVREAAHRYPSVGVHLWVFEPNVRARRFYSRLGGQDAERSVIEAPGGGAIAEWRVVWNSPEQLLLAVAEHDGSEDSDNEPGE
jgi:GNAT superfamily N-acetyltransferase